MNQTRRSCLSVHLLRDLRNLQSLRMSIDDLLSEIDEEDGGESAKKISQNSLYRRKIEDLLLNVQEFKSKALSRHEKSKQSRTAEYIRAGVLLERELTHLLECYDELNELYRSQSNTIAEEEKAERKQQLVMAYKQLQDCEELVDKREWKDANIYEVCDFKSQMEAADIDPPSCMAEWREPTDAERAVIDSWKERDQGIDQSILLIGDHVDKLTDLAKAIGEGALKQKELALVLSEKTDQANDQLLEANAFVARILSKGLGGSSFIPRVICIFIIVGLTGWLVSLISDALSF